MVTEIESTQICVGLEVLDFRTMNGKQGCARPTRPAQATVIGRPRPNPPQSGKSLLQLLWDWASDPKSASQKDEEKFNKEFDGWRCEIAIKQKLEEKAKLLAQIDELNRDIERLKGS